MKHGMASQPVEMEFHVRMPVLVIMSQKLSQEVIMKMKLKLVFQFLLEMKIQRRRQNMLRNCLKL